ncbi:hypothetical protein EW146_g7174 [Bondarzewia mesenterica]|uniref:HhH-GPD domain-containing protein n=1 Tax=Bondarzewia mesenterica TaxID=1095465 RepID=A0A4S4LLI6_9AGAM|nr:hypothetical protein EW146_g7174 [Bondarzewia mesenterica]
MSRGVKRHRSHSADLSSYNREPSSSLSPPPASPTASTSSLSTSKTAQRTKKLKILNDFTSSSPFPEYHHPTVKEAQEVHALLAKVHPQYAATRKAPSESANSASTCGSVPNVIDSLIGTILSQNTNAANSTGAKRSLDDTFGRHNFGAIADAPRDEVIEAIRSGGLANRKATIIQNLLRAIRTRHGTYSLQHLASSSVSDSAAMEELVSYDGVGPKTAACVLLFCLGRDSFAVDTHVYRLSRLLGWVPAKADRVQAQMHLDVRVPNELKYALHVLMVQHGRACKGCKANGKGSAGNCVLKDYLRERKGMKEEEIEATAEGVEAEAKEEIEEL